MQIGMIGLGRMGANMVLRLEQAGHDCVGYDLSPQAVERIRSEGATGTTDLEEFVGMLATPRAIWMMVPTAYATETVHTVLPLLSKGDLIVDGGNSLYHDALELARVLGDHGIDFVDVGTSGGVFGRERGYCMMVGGEVGAVARLAPVLDALAPGVDAAPRTDGRTGAPAPAEKGWLHCGPAGAGHFVKMVHNGIEYGLMAAYAEGFNILAHAGIGNEERPKDAETAPLANPDHYRYDIDLGAVAEVWRRGSVISSWLLDLTAAAFVDDPGLEGFAGRVSDSGEGRWTLQAAIDEGVPAPVLSAALYGRFASRGRSLTGDKLQSAMRAQFGGHAETHQAPT